MKIKWRIPGGLKECPYFHGTYIPLLFGYSLRIHEWHADDDDHRYYHDHPSDFITFVLKGGYTDVSDNGNDVLSFGSIRYRKAEYQHSVQKVLPGTITILLFFPVRRRWGFLVDGKIIRRDKYFITKGHHPCDIEDKPVRIKPNGERLNEKNV